MTNERFHDLFGGPPRKPDRSLEQRHMDLAASIQAVTEEVMLRMGRDLHRADGHEEPGPGRRRGAQLRGQRQAAARGAVREHLDPAGGRRCRRRPWRGPVRLASAPRQAAHAERRRCPEGAASSARATPPTRSRRSSTSVGRRYQRFDDEAALLEHVVAGYWPTEKVVGWFQGRMEFGPRALGARSILGDPRSPKMQATMNLKIKFRESFRPFAPCVLREHVHEWFEMRPGEDSPVHAPGGAGASEAPRVAVPDEAESRSAQRPGSASGGSTSSAARCPPSPTSTTAPASRPSTSGTAASTGS